MTQYRLNGFSLRDLHACGRDEDDIEGFFEDFARDCRDDFAGEMTFVSGDLRSIIFEVSAEQTDGFDEMIADLNPGRIDKIVAVE